jgi:hypothetical protein
MYFVGRDSSVGLATSYGLVGRDFPYLSGPALGPTQSPVQWVPGPKTFVLGLLLLVYNDTVEHVAWLCSKTSCRFRYLAE